MKLAYFIAFMKSAGSHYLVRKYLCIIDTNLKVNNENIKS